MGKKKIKYINSGASNSCLLLCKCFCNMYTYVVFLKKSCVSLWLSSKVKKVNNSGKGKFLKKGKHV